MSDFLQITIGFILLAGVYVITRYGVARRMRRTVMGVVKELERQNAYDPDSAVALPYEKKDWLRVGLRDYRPQALTSLLTEGIVARTVEGRYYLARPLEEALAPEDQS